MDVARVVEVEEAADVGVVVVVRTDEEEEESVEEKDEVRYRGGAVTKVVAVEMGL